MYFCPNCQSMLLIEGRTDDDTEDGATETNAWICAACPYKKKVTKPVVKRTYLQRKQVDDVLGGDKAWDNVDRTKARCPKCEHDTAFFFQLQIRSADEPMTTFYRCEKCREQWKEN